MTDKPKPLTKAEWEVIRDGKWEGDEVSGHNLTTCMRRVDATMDALFRYRKRTRHGTVAKDDDYGLTTTDDVAREEGIE